MEASTPGRLKPLHTRIKKRWIALLRAEPATSPLAHPETLAFLMDETLAQLGTIGQSQSLKNWLAHTPSAITPLSGLCPCSLNPLLSYYRTGDQALREVVAEKLGPDTDELLIYFHGLAQKDIETLCGVCCRKSTANCSHREIALEETRHTRFLRR